MRRSFAVAIALAVVLLASGCLGYQLAGRATSSSVIPPGVTTIGIPPFGNQTDRPRLDQRISEALVNEFVQRGRYRAVPDARGAEVVLEGTIESFREDPVTFSTAGRFDRVEVTVTARLRLVQTSPEKVLWSQNHFVFREQYDLPYAVTGTTTTSGSLPSTVDTEIIAIDEIARGFARAAVTSLLEGF